MTMNRRRVNTWSRVYGCVGLCVCVTMCGWNGAGTQVYVGFICSVCVCTCGRCAYASMCVETTEHHILFIVKGS